MKKLKFARVAGLVLLLASCSTVNIPPEQAAWADSVREQIAAASATHYVYVPVKDKQEIEIVEYLAFKQGKSTQRFKKGGQIVECVFLFR